jgi:Zn-dependent protease with chaperone function
MSSLSLPASYHDDNTAARHEVRVTFGGRGLEGVHGDTGQAAFQWHWEDLRLVERGRGGRTVVTSLADPESRLVFLDAAAYPELNRQVPHLPRRRLDKRYSRRYAVVLATAGAIVVLLGVAMIPAISVLIGRALPAAWLDRLGRDAVVMLADGSGSCAEESGQAALNDLAGKLSVAAGLSPTPRVSVVGSSTVNAFAAPGGYIVLFDGVIALTATADELAAVLAHEIAHVLHRHPAEGLVRIWGLSAVLDSVFGGSGLAGTYLINAPYSRGNEAEVDATALRILEDAGLNAQGLAAFFERLSGEERRDGSDADSGYFSTHPATGDRLARAEGAPTGAAAALTPSSWAAVQAICR